jgi:hypothetical protein
VYFVRVGSLTRNLAVKEVRVRVHSRRSPQEHRIEECNVTRHTRILKQIVPKDTSINEARMVMEYMPKI